MPRERRSLFSPHTWFHLRFMNKKRKILDNLYISNNIFDVVYEASILWFLFYAWFSNITFFYHSLLSGFFLLWFFGFRIYEPHTKCCFLFCFFLFFLMIGCHSWLLITGDTVLDFYAAAAAAPVGDVLVAVFSLLLAWIGAWFRSKPDYHLVGPAAVDPTFVPMKGFVTVATSNYFITRCSTNRLAFQTIIIHMVARYSSSDKRRQEEILDFFFHSSFSITTFLPFKFGLVLISKIYIISNLNN